MNSSYGIIFFMVCVIFIQVTEGTNKTECLRNEQYGHREGNVYYCPNDNSPYTECCEKDKEFTCCENDTEKNLSEQFMLWGIVSAFVILLVIIGVCIKKDFNFCKSDRWVFYRFSKEGKKEQALAKEKQEKNMREYQPNYKDNENFVFDG